MPPPDLKSAAIGLLALILVPFIATLFGFVLGGFKIGYLKKNLVIKLRESSLPSFLATLRNRLAEIGFEEEPGTAQFFQGQNYDPETPTHATKKKVLDLQIGAPEAGDVTVNISFRYLDFILGDTGESAYRNGVLNFVSGKTDTMVIVPNNSFAAFVVLLDGIFACLAYAFLTEARRTELWFGITIYCVASIGLGLQAWQSIRQRPKELMGKWQAIIGIVLCLTVGLATIVPLIVIEVFKFLKRLGIL